MATLTKTQTALLKLYYSTEEIEQLQEDEKFEAVAVIDDRLHHAYAKPERPLRVRRFSYGMEVEQDRY